MSIHEMTTLEEARAAKKVAKEMLATLPGVAGIGITKIDKDFALQINLSYHDVAHYIPTHVSGVPVYVEVVGKIVKQLDKKEKV